MKKLTISHTNMLSCATPFAMAQITGNADNPLLTGTALFYHSSMDGILIQVEIFHLPDEKMPDVSGFFGMHLHEVGDCTLPFNKTGGHFNPNNRQHPDHAGDFPPLLSDHGYAWIAFYDARLSASDVIGNSIIIHAQRDDFTTQPSGNSGDKIGCGVVEAL